MGGNQENISEEGIKKNDHRATHTETGRATDRYHKDKMTQLEDKGGE